MTSQSSVHLQALEPKYQENLFSTCNKLEQKTKRSNQRTQIFGVTEFYSLNGNTVFSCGETCLIEETLSELLATIQGKDKAKDLGARWVDKTPTADYIKSLIDKQIEEVGEINRPPQSDIELMHKSVDKHPQIGSVGPSFGTLWREWPLAMGRGDFNWITGYEDIPKDKYRSLSQEFDRVVVLSNGQMKNTKEARETFIGDHYVKTIDQLNKVYLGLKRNPYGLQHIVSSHHPSVVGSFEDPRENVVSGYGAEFPKQTSFQFLVSDDEKTGEKRLSCILNVSSCNVAKDRPREVIFYSLLTIIMGHFLGYKPFDLIVNTGVSYLENPEDVIGVLSSRWGWVSIANTETNDLFSVNLGETISISKSNPDKTDPLMPFDLT